MINFELIRSSLMCSRLGRWLRHRRPEPTDRLETCSALPSQTSARSRVRTELGSTSPAAPLLHPAPPPPREPLFDQHLASRGVPDPEARQHTPSAVLPLGLGLVERPASPRDLQAA